MPFAQKPSILPSASARAAASPNEAFSPTAPGTGPICTSVTPARLRSCFSPSRGPGAAAPGAAGGLPPPGEGAGRGADAPALAHAKAAALRLEVVAHDQEPVHVLR